MMLFIATGTLADLQGRAWSAANTAAYSWASGNFKHH